MKGPSWFCVDSLSEQELILDLRRVRDAIRRRDPEYSLAGLKLREKELVAALAELTSTGRGRALSDVARIGARGRR